jgi:hypothetical protein
MAKKSDAPRYCKSCGQKVKGKIALLAANPVVVYCCESGDRLDSKGTCPNPNCPFFGQIPKCT